jgi:hypothetical protein
MSAKPMNLHSDQAEFSLRIVDCPCLGDRDSEGNPVKAGPLDWLVVETKATIKFTDQCHCSIELRDQALEVDEAHLLARWLEHLGAGKPASEVLEVVGAPCDMAVFTEQMLMFAAYPIEGGKTRIQVNLFHDAFRYLTVNPGALNFESPPEIAPIGQWQPWAMALNLDVDDKQLLAAAAALREQLAQIPQKSFGENPHPETGQ